MRHFREVYHIRLRHSFHSITALRKASFRTDPQAYRHWIRTEKCTCAGQTFASQRLVGLTIRTHPNKVRKSSQRKPQTIDAYKELSTGSRMRYTALDQSGERQNRTTYGRHNGTRRLRWSSRCRLKSWKTISLALSCSPHTPSNNPMNALANLKQMTQVYALHYVSGRYYWH